jgi:hypothetical protein
MIMKPISVVGVVASVAVLALAGACHKDEPTSQTNTTGATVTPEQPATEPVPPPVTTGTPIEENASTQSGMTKNHTTTHKSRDAGIAQDWPTGGADLNDGQSHSSSSANPQDRNNHSTPLGDSKSGEYTGGKGTYGGKATWGTGPQKGTKMDKPTPPSTTPQTEPTR